MLMTWTLKDMPLHYTKKTHKQFMRNESITRCWRYIRWPSVKKILDISKYNKNLVILYFWFCKFIGYSCKCYNTSWPHFVHIQVYYTKWRQKSKFQKQGQISVTGYQTFDRILFSDEFSIIIFKCDQV